MGGWYLLARGGVFRQVADVMKKLTSLGMAALLPILPAAAEVKLSERLTRIAGHLGEGGAHFSVTDSTDDLRNFGELIDQALGALPEGEVPFELKVEDIFDDLGLLALEGSGSSSHKVGEFWHNRTFFLTNGKHEGVLSLLGDEPEASIVSEFAPAGADFVMETTLDLREVERTYRKVAEAIGMDEEQEVGELLTNEVTGLGLSLADIFVDFTVRGALVFWMDDEKTFEASPGVQTPVPHFAARLDNAGLLWKMLKEELEGNEEVVIEEKDGEWIVRPKEQRMEVPWGTAQPQLVWSPETNQMFVSWAEADLKLCRGEGAKLTSDADFKRATTGFPAATNGLIYISRQNLEKAAKGVSQLVGEMPEEFQGVLNELMPHFETMVSQGGFAGGFSVEKDGFLFVANLPFPLKGNSSLLGVGGIATVATLAGIATPLIMQTKGNADAAVDMANMQAVADAQLLYKLKKGGFAYTLKDLAAEKMIELDVAGELEEQGVVFMVKSSGEAGNGGMIAFLSSRASDDEVLVAFGDGRVEVLSDDELGKLHEGE